MISKNDLKECHCSGRAESNCYASGFGADVLLCLARVHYCPECKFFVFHDLESGQVVDLLELVSFLEDERAGK